jgi:uncharacterized protein involved in type VI secretion and phage assembly
MSISVRSIQLSINGTQSQQFKIELEGAKYRIDNLSLRQQLLAPNVLSFVLRKDPEEDISEIQFSACTNFIGKDVTLTLQTDAIEQKLSSFSEGGKNADVEFEGFVTSAHASRYDSEYVIQVEAKSKDAAMFDSPDCHMYNEKSLSDIVNDVVKRSSVKASVQPKYEDQIFYTVQYNESSYGFLQRLASRYGEWMFSTGKELHFGKLSDQESIQLKYPSLDMPEYSVSLQTCHQKFKQSAKLYNEPGKKNDFSNEEDAKDTGNKLNDAVAAASKEIYKAETNKIVTANSIEKDDEAEGSPGKETHKEEMLMQEHMRRSNMLVYHGTTYCSKLKIGMKLTIMDNYVAAAGERSEVQQEEILITEVTHTFGVDAEYSNTFSGIAGSIDYPPYLNPAIYPRCDHPVRADVTDTEDPKHWGRVKVRFTWQEEKEEEQTPWIHVAQPYTGGEDPYGTHLIPEVKSHVFVDFEEGNYERPFVRAAHFGAKTPVDENWYPGNNNVKAIRTASGHTIEIHDTQEDDDRGQKGYIRIYDNELNYYEVLLSTDDKLIKLYSAGNIEMYADNDIIMEAKKNIKMTAKEENVEVRAKKKDVIVKAGTDYDLKAKNNISTHADNESGHYSGGNYWVTTDSEMTLTGKSTVQVISQEDEIQVSAQKSIKMETKEEGSGTVETTTDTFSVSAQKKISLTDTMDMELNCSNGFTAYCATMDINANAKVNITATASIDLKAPIVNET